MNLDVNPITLSFKKELEIQYQEVFFRDSLPVLRIAMFTSVFLFAGFGYLDYLLIEKHLNVFLLIRFAVIIPFLLGVFLLSYTSIFQKIWQLLLFLSFLLAGLGIITMLILGPEIWSYYGGLLLIFFAGYFFIRLRFFYASLAGSILTLSFIGVMFFFVSLSPEVITPYSFFYLSANCIGMFASYYIEMTNRRNFFLALQLDQRKKEQEQINVNLESIVKERTRELQDSEERFRNLADLLPLMVYEADFEGNVLYANQQALMQMGVSDHDLKQGVNLLSFAAPSNKEKAAKKFKEAFGQEGISKGEFLAVRKDGSTMPIIDYSSPIMKGGKVVGLRSVAIDLSDQKKTEQALKSSEERYKLLVENAFDGIYLAYDSKFEYVNNRLCEITQYTREELMHDSFGLEMLLTSDSLEIINQRKYAREQGGDVPTNIEIKIITKSGTIKDIELSSILLKREPTLFFLGVVRDITEKKVNEKLRNEIVVAKQSAEFKQQFLANMSHEIRTPLTGIIGMIEILSGTELNQKQQEYIKTLELSTENLREIINQILDYSKIEAGKVMLKPVIFKSKNIIDAAYKLFHSICRKPITFEIIVDEEIPSYIQADEGRIHQIISNLLSNAVKFTYQGRIVVKAELQNWIDDSRFFIKITVDDTGIGISKEQQTLLFKPFSQVDHKDTRNFEGTGLGLSICCDLVRLMGGKMGFRSKTGIGSMFWFTFEAQVAKKDAEGVTTYPNNLPGQAGKSLSILIAEDKLVNQKVIGLILSSMGHEITTANNGEEAVELFGQGQFDLVLMDIQMPVMNGIEATQKLKELYHNLPPIVGLSANAFEGDREKYMAKGMDEYLTKPFKKNDFLLLVQRLGL